jgi:hypothetical protein
LGYIVGTMTLDHIILTVIFDTTNVFDTIAAFVILLVTLLITPPVMWHEEFLKNFSVLQTEQVSNLVLIQAVIKYITVCFRLLRKKSIELHEYDATSNSHLAIFWKAYLAFVIMRCSFIPSSNSLPENYPHNWKAFKIFAFHVLTSEL